MRARVFRRPGCIPWILVLALSGCGHEAQEIPAPVARPVKTLVVAAASAGGSRSFPARIEAAQRADLGFRVRGTLQEITVKEGDLVAQGDLLAHLDPTDYEIVLRDRQANFDSAERNYQRAQQLIGGGNISKMDYDRVEATFKSAEAALATARQDLEYTRLTAPFAGRVARRHVENFEEVLAKQTVITLNQIDRLEARIDLPESVLRSIRVDSEDPEDEGRVRDRVSAQATFEGIADRSFDLQFKEIATRADPRTQTFEVAFTMPAPKDVLVLPGMTATVTLDLSRIEALDEMIRVPAGAVVGDAGLDAGVWILDPETMTVSRRRVSIGAMDGDRVQVTAGLLPGDEVVTVGAAFLAEGMRVTRLEGGEQAVPREGDLH